MLQLKRGMLERLDCPLLAPTRGPFLCNWFVTPAALRPTRLT